MPAPEGHLRGAAARWQHGQREGPAAAAPHFRPSALVLCSPRLALASMTYWRRCGYCTSAAAGSANGCTCGMTGPSPLTWPASGDGHVRLFGAMRPLRLRALVLGFAVLQLGDVMALVEQLPELQYLVLRSQLHPAAVPLLARLPNLANLTLFLPSERNLDDWSCASTVAACLMPLLLNGPSLKGVHIEFLHQTDVDHVDGDPRVDAVQEGVLWIKAQLQRLGRDPGMITMDT